jgi:cytochrome c oxidase subunit 4
MAEAAEITEMASPADTEERRPHPEGGSHRPHPTDSQYVGIAAILFLITGVEVALSYLKIGALTNPALLVLAATKFAMVAMFFMHLRFDNKLLRRLFVTGLVLAVCVYIAVMLTFGIFVRRP